MRSARTEEKVVLSLDDMDIDHILPQSWAEYWPLANSMAVSQQEVSDAVLLSYPSANRDEDVFDDPFRFDIGRTPNKHLAFGFGVHYCLGAMLARMELKALFGALLPRLKSVELAGTPELIRSTFVSGLKRLPIRYQLD